MGRFGVEVVDADGHVVESRAALARHGWQGHATDLIDQLLAWGDEPGGWKGGINPAARGAYDVPGRLDDMDAEGIDAAVCYPTPLLGISDFDDPAAGVAAARSYNDWFAAEWHAAAPDRIHGMALVSLLDGPAAAAEARRAVSELGACGVMVQAYAGDVHLCDPHLEDLWSVLEELDVPAAVHGSRSTCPPMLRGDMFRNQARFYAMSHPFQQQVAMADLALGGVLERHPGLTVAFLESGVGWMPYFIDRLDEAYESVREDWVDDRFVLERAPSEYLRSGRCWFACEPDEQLLATMVDALGEDQVIYASDYPHFDAKFPDSARLLLEGGGLSPRAAAKVAGRNARRLYRI